VGRGVGRRHNFSIVGGFCCPRFPPFCVCFVHFLLVFLPPSPPPLFSSLVLLSYGDEVALSPFMASLTAMSSFVRDLGNVSRGENVYGAGNQNSGGGGDDNGTDELRYLRTGDRLFVFQSIGPLVFVCVTTTGEPVDRLVQQLNYLHLQILSLLTRGVEQIFERRAAFDLRNLLGGADRFLDSLCSMMDHDPSLYLNAIHCLRLPHSKRDAIARAMQAAGAEDLLYAICLAKDKLVSLIRPKRYILQPADLHLLLNFINASAVFRSGESWTPVCLPKVPLFFFSSFFLDVCFG
jgi:First Longin domain of FUZ, MON1 and HPS1/Second Longin domain of FUZ, MON1 and HPS1